MDIVRRKLLTTLGGAGAGLLLLSCDLKSAKDAEEEKSEKEGKTNAGTEVTATEDLMREHGVLRRCLLVYEETAARMRTSAASVSFDALRKTAGLFRTFGEEYHEKKLEEAYIFPAVQKAGGLAAAYIGVLNAQHVRGREITDYLLTTAIAGKTGNGQELARALDAFARMYNHHAAVEDTIIFPAWKQTLNKDEFDKLSDDFEAIEQQQFGKDGFEDAAKQIADIEATLGLADLGQFTAPPPGTSGETGAAKEKPERKPSAEK